VPTGQIPLFGRGKALRWPLVPDISCTTALAARAVAHGACAFHKLDQSSHSFSHEDRPGVALRIGILTGGGDCPGLNAVIRAIVRRGVSLGESSFVGFRYGWAGVLEHDVVELTRENTAGILPRGGTILGTSRTNPLDGRADGLERIRDTFERERLDALIPIGGEDTLGVALRLAEAGLPIVGVPKTIDNDIGGTDVTFGFHTAVQIATEAIDRLHTTAESHNRVMVVEVMGRHAGWIATYAGIAGGADVILVPELPFDVNEVCARLRHRHASGITFSIVVVAEGSTPREGSAMSDPSARGTDEFGHVQLGGIGVDLEHQVESLTGYQTRATILGYVQRGGTPTAYDRVLATRFGVAAMDAAAGGRFGQMVALQGQDIVEVSLGDALAEPKLLDPRLFETAEVFFG
jgi:ATP-dependent phosphofructokinase / diphosphate-dependent phosphofructokinase